MSQSYSANADLGANWPLVVGIGILAAVLFYALYIVNQQLTPLSTATGGLANFLGSIETGIENIGSGLQSLFGGNPSDQ